MNKLPLKYLFTVLYKDGSTFQQAPDDVSAIDPQRSSFTDATHNIENGKFVLDGEGKMVSRLDDIARFMIMVRGGGVSYMVDLATGHFEIGTEVNNTPIVVPFRFHALEKPYLHRTLVYHRKHYHDILCQAKEPPKEINHRIVFCIGWEAVCEGKLEQHVMEID